MKSETSLLTRLALGALGGLAGTLALRSVMTAVGKQWPASMPPMHGEPGEFMVEQAENALPSAVRHRIPETAEKVTAKMLGPAYGIAFGALYAAFRPNGGSSFTDGLALGAGCWAAGYLGWLPATGLMSPVTEQTPEQVAVPLAEHLVYGMATVAAYNAIEATTH